MYKKAILALGFTASLFASCKKDDNPQPDQKIKYASLTTTTNYFNTFKGSDSLTSVDFSGQTTRIKMLKELDAYMKTFATTTLSASKMKDMFKNENNAFSDAILNTAGKNIFDKTAASFATPGTDRQMFMDYFDSLAATSTSASQAASAGVAGLLDNKYLVNAKGFEYNQFVVKSLIGAMLLDQISNVYLGTDKQGADNSAIVSGKNYTQLEHHWDEAYGYLTSSEYFPKKDSAGNWLESYLGGYVRQVNGDYGSPEAIYMAFLKGRAAIVNKDMSTRDAQIASIRTALEKAVATVAVSYLNKTKTGATDGAKFHALSEGFGFIYSLRFAYNAKIDRTKSDQLLTILTSKPNGFWGLGTPDIDNVRNQIADAFGINREAVVNH